MFFFNNCESEKSQIDKTTVADFELEKFLGTWYEIARFDHKFERGLVGVMANYSMREDGMIKVLNSGYKNSFDGKFSKAEGKAKIADPKIMSKLKVSFFWIFYADYFVLELDKDYKWAVIGSSSDNYLWVLSREPLLNASTLENILLLIEKRGYDKEKLIYVEQKQ
jgi:apolipoprotein D and lipocalin family protein